MNPLKVVLLALTAAGLLFFGLSFGIPVPKIPDSINPEAAVAEWFSSVEAIATPAAKKLEPEVGIGMPSEASSELMPGTPTG